MKEVDTERPYTGPWLNEQSELVFLQNADYHEISRYCRAWRLTPDGEKLLVGNCRPEAIKAYTEVWSLRPENEVRLVERKDSSLIQAYIRKYPLCYEAQKLLVEHGRKEDIFCLVGTKFPLHSEVIKMLPQRGDGLLEAYYSVAKFRAI